MAKAKTTCIIPDCKEDVRYIHLQVCAACYSGLARWRGRSIVEKRHRMDINRRLVSRMDFIMEHPKHHPARRPRKRTL